MINNFSGKSFGDAFRHTKDVLDNLHNHSSLSYNCQGIHIDVCNSALYDNKKLIAVVDPEERPLRTLKYYNKILITKCIEINKVEDYSLIVAYIYEILKELTKNRKKTPDTLIIPYISNNCPNALVLENYIENNDLKFNCNFLYDANHLEYINNALKPINWSICKKHGLYAQTNNIFEFIYHINDIVNLAAAKDYDNFLDKRGITIEYNTEFESKLKSAVNLALKNWNDTPMHATFTGNNHFTINDFFDAIENVYSFTDSYNIHKTNDCILISDRINNKQILKAQAYNNQISVLHNGNNNTWLALFNAMHKTSNFKCEFSFTGNAEESKKLAEQFLQAVNNQIDENTGILDDAIFDMDEKTKDIINQVLNDPAVMQRLGSDKVLTYFGLNYDYPEIESKNTSLFEKPELPKRASFKMH